jgi:hypothetical protein
MNCRDLQMPLDVVNVWYVPQVRQIARLPEANSQMPSEELVSS